MIVGVMMVIHLIVTYTLLQQVLTRATCSRFVPAALSPGVLGHGLWFCVSTGFMMGAWLVANSMPLFTDIINITGSLLQTQLAFTIPAFMYLSLRRQGLTGDEEGLGKFFMPISYLVLVMAAYFTAVGTYSSVRQMIDHATNGINPPFSCALF